MKVEDIEIKKIKGNPYQTRIHIEKEPLKLLTKSILQRGLFNPITILEENPGEYLVVHGHRRLEAYKNLKWKTIPAFVKPRSEKDSLITDLIHENLMREDLIVQEKALCLKLLLSQIKNIKNNIEEMIYCINGVHMYKERGMPKHRRVKTKHTDDDVFECMGLLKTVGMSENNAVSYLRVLQLPTHIQGKVAFNVSAKEKRSSRYISIRTAVVIARVKDRDLQEYLFRRALEGVSARYLDVLVNHYIEKSDKGEWEGFTKPNSRISRKLMSNERMIELSEGCQKLATKINSWKLTRLIPLSDTMDQEVFMASALGLKKDLDLLSKAIERRFKDKGWKNIEDKKGNEVFELQIKLQSSRKTCRGTIPVRIIRSLNVKSGDYVQAKIVGVRRK